jgi:hypothetical protein
MYRRNLVPPTSGHSGTTLKKVTLPTQKNIWQQKLSKLNTVHYHCKFDMHRRVFSQQWEIRCVRLCVHSVRTIWTTSNKGLRLPWRSRHQATIKPRYVYAKLHGVLSQKTEIFMSPSHLDSVFIIRSYFHKSPHSPAQGLHREALRRTDLFSCTERQLKNTPPTPLALSYTVTWPELLRLLRAKQNSCWYEVHLCLHSQIFFSSFLHAMPVV